MAKKKAADEQNPTSENGRHSSSTGSDWQQGEGARSSSETGSDWTNEAAPKKEEAKEGE
jgi:hypothetical protein